MVLRWGCALMEVGVRFFEGVEIFEVARQKYLRGAVIVVKRSREN